MQLPQVLQTALGQIAVGLHGDTGRHRGALHQLGIRGLFTADHDQWQPAGGDRVETVGPGPVPTEQAHHHHLDAAEQFRQFAVDQPGRIGQPELCTAGTRGHQVGIRGGQQQDDGSRRR